MRRPLVAAACLVLAACSPPPPPPAGPDAIAVTAAPEAVRGRVAAHWFGRQWPKNWLAGFRHEHVDADFATLRADGFDTVVLVLAWGDFMPVHAPCCDWDERAWARLRFLLDRASAAGLKVMLRVGFGVDLDPRAGPSSAREHALLNDPRARAAWLRFAARVGEETAARPEVVLTFLSWEDHRLQRVEPGAAGDLAAYLASRSAGAPPPRPAPDGGLVDPHADAATFLDFADWLAMERLYRPARAQLPRLSYEARVDVDPLPPAADGTQRPGFVHERMFALPADVPLIVYWAPFWGAHNAGERLSAARSRELLGNLLDEAALRSGRELFVDQFNFIDNTIGTDTHAAIAAEEMPAFLAGAPCTLRAHHAIGYGLWTARDYAESPLFNPAFGYGLDGWTLATADDSPAADRLEALPSGDFQLHLAAGDRLAQAIPASRGRLPRAGDALDDRLCVEAIGPGRLRARAGHGEAVELDFPAGPARRCRTIAPERDEAELELALEGLEGTVVLRDVQFFDHVQEGGLRGLDGEPGRWHAEVVSMNRRFPRLSRRACVVADTVGRLQRQAVPLSPGPG